MSALTDRPTTENPKSMVDALMEAIVDGIITIDGKGIIHSLNPATERIFGYNKDELIGKNVKVLMPEPYQSEHDQYLENFHNTGHKKIIGIGREVLGRRKNGEIFPLELAVNDMLLDDKPMFAGIVRDISERKAIYDQLHLQSGALEAAANAILITDKDGIIQWVNTAFTALTGYSPDEVAGKSTRILKSGKQSQTFYKELWRTINEGRVWQGEIVNKRKDGTLYTEEQTITPVVDSVGKVSHFIAIKLDVSERKRSEKAMAQQAKALEKIAEYERTQSRVFALFNTYRDSKAIFKEMLDILAESHGMPVSAVYAFEEWQGHLKCVASHGLPDTLSKTYEVGEGLIGQAAQSERQIVMNSDESDLFKIDTGLFNIQPSGVIITPLLHSGKLLGVLVLASLLPLEQQLLIFIERLSKQVAMSLNGLQQYQHLKALSEQLRQRGQEVSDKNAQLEQSNRLKTEFLANMSHELRTPLNAIIGFSEVLRDDLLGDLNEEQKDYINEIFLSANHLLSLINDILDLSKIEAGKMQLHLETVNLQETLRNSISIVRERAHQHNISLTVDIDETINFIEADSRKLKQILFNLLSNAVKFTPDGGKVTLSAHQANGTTTIAVQDTGIGISKKKQHMLFEPFVQLDGSLSRHYEGTGLGLAMVKRLVDLHGGSIDVTSNKGKGSTFSFTIPKKPVSKIADRPDGDPARKPEVEKSETPKPDSLSQLKPTVIGDEGNQVILMIEQDAEQAELMTIYLEDEGWQVQVASSIQEGLELMQQFNPALITIDLLMPNINCVNFIEIKQSMPEYAHIPVMAISKLGDAHSCQIVAADAILNKPIRRSELMELIERLTHSIEKSKNQNIDVLLIDDDPQAIKVISSFLKDSRFKVSSALSGSDGLASVKQSKPDVIILDLMMPEMTGFEVLDKLRSDPEFEQIPVIVLTAKLLTESDRKQLKGKASLVTEKGRTDRASIVKKIDYALSRQR